MDLYLKTVIYEDSIPLDQIELNNLKNIGFDCTKIVGSDSKLFEFLSKSKIDILICYSTSTDVERLEYILDIIYNNYCKHILVLGNQNFNEDKYFYLKDIDGSNFDLKLNRELLKIKKQIESNPARNITIIKSKICEILCSFMFSSKHDGFKYYADAILASYLSFPFSLATMGIYKDIAAYYGKSVGAVEKSMRSALLYAFSKLKDAPVTPEILKKRTYLTYDMNNNTAISMMVSQLVLDKEINPSFEYNSSCLVK